MSRLAALAEQINAALPQTQCTRCGYPDCAGYAEAVAAGQAKAKKDESRSADMIVLKDSFYDMNTWDLDAAPESTRRRWRADINEKLDGMIDDALAEVQVILEAEGLLMKEAA